LHYRYGKCPVKVRWFRSPPHVCIWFQLVLGSVSVLFILGISSLQQMSYFRRSHFNTSNLVFWWIGWHQDPRWCCLLLGDGAFTRTDYWLLKLLSPS
jgi:hypothetical protein